MVQDQGHRLRVCVLSGHRGHKALAPGPLLWQEAF